MTRRVHRAAMSRRARAELAESIAYIMRDSPQSARAVQRAIEDKIAQVRRFPESAPADPDAPAPRGDATPRVTHVSGFIIRCAFPVRREDRDVVYIVSIQRAGRVPLDDSEYGLRFLREAARVYATVSARAGTAP